MQLDREKLKDLIHYVIWHAADRDGFGATKLYKVLWFAEARQFILHGKPITGVEFIREKHGPIPSNAMAYRKALVAEGRVREWNDRYYNRTITRFRALTPPSTTRFTSDELQTVDWWIKHIDEEHTAASISEESHDYAWEIAAMREPLPLHATLASRVGPPSPKGLAWAREKARELGLI